MNAINDLLQHREFAVRELGQKAVQYKSHLEQGLITREEYARLCRQLLDLERLNAAANRADDRQAIAEAVRFLGGFLGVLL